jgi:hypothetical protein
MKGNKPDQKTQAWIDARTRHRLSHAQVQMARELGLNPKKLGGMDNHQQEAWKIPLPQFIEHIYFKRFRKSNDRTWFFLLKRSLVATARSRLASERQNCKRGKAAGMKRYKSAG